MFQFGHAHHDHEDLTMTLILRSTRLHYDRQNLPFFTDRSAIVAKWDCGIKGLFCNLLTIAFYIVNAE